MDLINTKHLNNKPVHDLQDLPIEFLETLSYLLIGKTPEEIENFKNTLVVRKIRAQSLKPKKCVL